MKMPRAILEAMRLTAAMAGLSLLLSSMATLAAEAKPPNPAADFLLMADRKLENGTFGLRDRVSCDAFISTSKDPVRGAFITVLARYHRVMERKPVEALTVLAPLVLGPEKAAAWVKAQTDAAYEALATWKEEERQALREKTGSVPEKPAALQVPFPPFAEWTVNSGNAGCVLETARVLLDLNRSHEALAAVNAVGAKFEEWPRVLAAECGGDLMAQLQSYQKAVEFYEFGLGAMNATVTYLGGVWTDEQRAVKGRIERKLAEARRLLDVEKFGKGWALYRNAEQKRLGEKAYAEALLLYEDIRKEFPKTVWSEAATCYSVKCLLALADPAHARHLSGAIKAVAHDISERRKRLAEKKAALVPEPARKEDEGELATVEQRLARLKSVPTGPQAVQVAERMAQAFVKENEFGLYRGEVLAELAEYALERELLPEKGMRRYTQAWAWLEQVGAMDAALESFDVPGKAKAVSAPPAVEEKQDYFGNFKREGIQIGAVLNRRTCGWYLDDLREKTVLALGFLEFCKERKEAALAWFEKVVALDQKTGYLQSKGEWNNYRRMKWGAENGYLYAYPQELSLYDGRQRFAVLLGDFYYCTMQFSRSQLIANRLLNDTFGHLSAAQKDYALFVKAASEYRTGQSKQAYATYKRVFERREGTLTEDRAAYAAGNISADSPEAKIRDEGLEILKQLAFCGRRNEFVYLARFGYANRLRDLGQETEGLQLLRNLPKEAGDVYLLAQWILGQQDKSRNPVEQKRGNP